jgi:hypothetical protein
MTIAKLRALWINLSQTLVQSALVCEENKYEISIAIAIFTLFPFILGYIILLLLLLLRGKAVPVTGHEGPQGCETLRVPHYLDNRPTDGLTRRPPFTHHDDS